MGGFNLIGPNYVFQNLPNTLRCRCLGFSGAIDKDTEKMLYDNPVHKLNLETLPTELVETMQGFHLGENMYYSVKQRSNTSKELPYKSQVDANTKTNDDLFVWTAPTM